MSPLFQRDKLEENAKETFTVSKRRWSRSQGVQRYLKSNWFILCSLLRNPGTSTKLKSKWGASQRIKCPCTHTGSWCRLIELPDWFLLGAYPLHLVLCWVSIQRAYHSFSDIWLPLPICINPHGHWSLQPLLQLCHETMSDNHNENYNQSYNPDICIMI